MPRPTVASQYTKVLAATMETQTVPAGLRAFVTDRVAAGLRVARGLRLRHTVPPVASVPACLPGSVRLSRQSNNQ